MYLYPSNVLLVKHFCSAAHSRTLTSTLIITDWVKVPFEGVDYNLSDIRFELADDPDTCQKICTADFNCQFYTYAREDFFDPTYRYSIL